LEDSPTQKDITKIKHFNNSYFNTKWMCAASLKLMFTGNFCPQRRESTQDSNTGLNISMSMSPTSSPILMQLGTKLGAPVFLASMRHASGSCPREGIQFWAGGLGQGIEAKKVFL
jgi:hypothetical protein